MPLSLLNQLDDARLTWLVPGMIREKVTHYLKSLPKAWRNRLIPLPEVVTAFLESAPDAATAVAARRCAATCEQRLGDAPPPDVLGWHRLAARISPSTCASSTRPAASWPWAATSPRCARSWARPRSCRSRRADPAFEKRGMRSWDFGDLPETLAVTRGAQRLTGYPALVDDGDSVSLALLDTREAADASTRAGVLRLLRLALKDAAARLRQGRPGIRAGRAAAQDGDSHRPAAGRRAGRG